MALIIDNEHRPVFDVVIVNEDLTHGFGKSGYPGVHVTRLHYEERLTADEICKQWGEGKLTRRQANALFGIDEES